MNNKCCPSCKNNLDKQIKRKMKCPKCMDIIYVRQGNPVTEREKEIIDWLFRIDYLVPSLNKIRTKVEKNLEKRFGKQPSSNDLIWGIFNYIIPKLKDPSDLENLYMNMGVFLDSEGKYKQAIQVKKVANKMRVKSCQDSDFIKGMKIINANDDFVCKYCEILNNKELSFKEALKDPLIPHEKCGNDTCRCRLVSVYEYENDRHNDEGFNETITIKLENKNSPGLFSKIFKKLFP